MRKSSRSKFRVWWIAARARRGEFRGRAIEGARERAGEDNINCSSDLLAMASLMRQLQSKAAVATELAAKHGSTFYKRLLEENKQYIQHEPTVQKCQELSKQLFYTRLASLPGRYDALWKEIDYVKQKIFARNDLKLEELGIAALFLGECYAWFCVGEIVGRGGTLTGYKV